MKTHMQVIQNMVTEKNGIDPSLVRDNASGHHPIRRQASRDSDFEGHILLYDKASEPMHMSL